MSPRAPARRVSDGAAADTEPSATAGTRPRARRRKGAAPSPEALLLFPGAGSAASHPSLRAIEAAVAPLPTRRADFPYRKEGRRAPDRPPKLLACVEEEAARLAKRAKVDPERLLLGGRSMGGRMCSIAVADGLPACGLVLISYPLHPPGKPDNLRVEHFPRIAVPCLFVSGTRDSFGTPDEMERHTAAIAGPVEHVWIEGKGHDLKGSDQLVADAVSRWVAARRA
jgi:predicted alpha/beta-hydrolase family hydrolase